MASISGKMRTPCLCIVHNSSITEKCFLFASKQKCPIQAERAFWSLTQRSPQLELNYFFVLLDQKFEYQRYQKTDYRANCGKNDGFQDILRMQIRQDTQKGAASGTNHGGITVLHLRFQLRWSVDCPRKPRLRQLPDIRQQLQRSRAMQWALPRGFRLRRPMPNQHFEAL